MTTLGTHAVRKRTVRIPKSHVITGRRDKDVPTKKRKKKKNTVRGKEVSIRESASEGQIVYGRMKIGGNYTFVDTSKDSKAYLVTNSGNRQIAWIAKTGGAGGNAITITIIVPTNNATLLCDVVGNNITITAKSSGGSSQSTANQVINKVRNTPAADALVNVNTAEGDGTGNVQDFPTTNLANGGGTWLHQMVTLAAHEIDAIENLYIDGKEVTFGAAEDPRWGTGVWSNRVFMALNPGRDDQEAQPDLMAQLPDKWLSTDRQRGCAGAYLIFKFNTNTFPEGFPEVTFKVRGKKCYDPRTGLTVWTRNAALITADYIANDKWGGKVGYSKINTAQLIAAADICDAAVSIPGGGTEARYCIDGVLDTSEDFDNVLEEFSAAMGGGDIVTQAGEWFIYPAAWQEPTITLDENDLRGEIAVTTHISRSDIFNCIRGTYVSPSADYNEADFPAVKNSTYIAEDGGIEYYEDITLNFVTQGYQAQRIADIELQRIRQGITVVYPCKLKGLILEVGNTVEINNERFGWSGKIFEVRKVDWVMDDAGVGGVDLILRETAEAIYDDSLVQTEIDLAPNSDLPSATDVEPPTDVTLSSGTSELYIRGDGTVITRIKVSWTASETDFVVEDGKYQIQFKQSLETDWDQMFDVQGTATFAYITDVKDLVLYDVRIRAVNGIGFASDWVLIEDHLVEGKSAKPSDVTGFAYSISDDGILLTWNDISDVDRFGYEIRRGGSNWDTATVIEPIQGAILQYLYPYRTEGTIVLRIKAIDTTGNYSNTDATVSVTIVGPNPVNDFQVSSVKNNVLINWTTPDASTFSVHQYDVYKGDVFGNSVKLGTVFGTFHTYIEKLGGTFKYWVVAVDVGGNRSTAVSAEITIVVPDDFFIEADQNPLPDYTDYLNCVIGGSPLAPYEDDASLWLPVSTGSGGSGGLWLMMLSGGSGVETIEQWFDNNGWTTLQDAIDDGYDQWLQPGTTTPGYVEMVIDYGVTFNSSFVNWSWTETILGDPTVITPTISTSPDGLAWTDYVSATQVFASNFRYLKLRLDFTGTSTFSLSRLSDFRVIISLQREEETQIVDAFAADTDMDPDLDGTFSAFVKDFLDVEDIQLTVEGVDPGYPVLNFDDVPDPVGYRILVFDEDGNRRDASVRARIRGAVQVNG